MPAHVELSACSGLGPSCRPTACVVRSFSNLSCPPPDGAVVYLLNFTPGPDGLPTGIHGAFHGASRGRRSRARGGATARHCGPPRRSVDSAHQFTSEAFHAYELLRGSDRRFCTSSGARQVALAESAVASAVAFSPPVELLKPKNPTASHGAIYKGTVHLVGVDAGKKPWSFEANLLALSQANAGHGHSPYTLKLDKAPPAGVTVQSVTLTYTPTDSKVPSHTLVFGGVKADPITSMQVAFVYQKISWTWTDGGKTFSDDWTSTN